MTAQTAQPRRLSGLDGLRALAISAVIVYHLNPAWLPGGFLGVDLFFVISGFLITSLLLRSSAAANLGPAGIGAFYLRRAKRILPATVLLVGVLVVVATTTVGLVTLQTGDVLAGLGFATNWWQISQGRDYFAAFAPPSSLQHLWSLAIEEQFYLLWPTVIALAALLAGRWKRRPEGLIAGLAFAGAAASGAWLAYLAVTGDIPTATSPSRVYYGTDTHASGILIGAGVAALLALRARPARSASPRWSVQLWVEGLGLLAIAGVVGAMVFLGENDPLLYRGGFVAVGVVAVLAIWCVSRPWSYLGRALDVFPLRWIGVVSFELYLWHWPVGLAAKTAPWAQQWWWLLAQVAAMLVLAGVSHHYVTVPIWHPRPQRTRARLAPVFGVGALAGLAAAVVTFAVTVPPALAGPLRPWVGSLVVMAPPPPPPPPPTALGLAALQEPISAFGDSVLEGAAPTLVTAMPKLTVTAKISMPPSVIYGWVRQAQANGTLAPIVVIHAGDNGYIPEGSLPELLGELSDRTLVVLVTIRTDNGPQYMRNAENCNQTIRAVAPTFRNVVVADWAAASEGHPEYLWDKVHTRPSGTAVFTQVIQEAIVTFVPPAPSD